MNAKNDWGVEDAFDVIDYADQFWNKLTKKEKDDDQTNTHKRRPSSVFGNKHRQRWKSERTSIVERTGVHFRNEVNTSDKECEEF